MTKIDRKKSDEVISKEVESSNAEGPNVCSMKNLIVSHDDTIEDKIATVKTAQIVDKTRFEIAFKTLMKR